MPHSESPDRPFPWWKWSSAGVAVLVTAAGAWWLSRPPRPPKIVSVDVKVTGVVQNTAPVVKAPIPETLTPDPK